MCVWFGVIINIEKPKRHHDGKVFINHYYWTHHLNTVYK